MYSTVFITNIPSFYKINLFNEINKSIKIYVIFLAKNMHDRTTDFIKSDIKFKYCILNNSLQENRNLIKSFYFLIKKLSNLKFKYVIVGGWDLIEIYLIIFLLKKRFNGFMLESHIYDSSLTLIKKLLKKLFLSRISMVFASGDLHRKLLKRLNFSGKIIIVKGVGIINKPKTYFIDNKKYTKRFLFLGRLIKEKNLELIISVFNELPNYTLTIVGNGPLEEKLKRISNNNIIYNRHIDNSKIEKLFYDNDFLILPSLNEAWGLVVDEAFYFNTPVIISKYCGSSEIVINEMNGLITNNDFDNLKNLLLNITAVSHQNYINSLKKYSINIKDDKQVLCYVENLKQ